MSFKIDTVALAVVHMRCEDESSEEAAEAMCVELTRQLRADPRGKDLPEDPSEALDVLLRCAAVLDAAEDGIPSAEGVASWLYEQDAGKGEWQNAGDIVRRDNLRRAERIIELFQPLLGAALAERNLWKDDALTCHMVLVEIRKALGITGEEWNNAPWSALVPRVKALVAQAKPTPKSDPPPERAVYTTGDRNALDLALAFLDDVLADARQPRINRKALPPLGTAGWATAWLGQATLAKLAAARVQHPEVQRRIFVGAMELERVLFGLFDRAVPMADEAPPSPKGGRRAAT